MTWCQNCPDSDAHLATHRVVAGCVHEHLYDAAMCPGCVGLATGPTAVCARCEDAGHPHVGVRVHTVEPL